MTDPRLKTVTVKIREDYVGHHHEGREVQPGEEIELTADRAAFLERIGAIHPIKATRKWRSRKETSADEPEQETEPIESDEPTTED